jgi:flagellar basal-body rod protein FlgC
MGTDALEISASGLRAQRIRMEVVANNLANMETTNAGSVKEGDFVRYIPYRRKTVIFEAAKGDKLGVAVPRVVEDKSEFPVVNNEQHPHAVHDKTSPDYGKVLFPNVSPMIEMVDMLAASRAYEANAAAIETLKTMSSTTLRLLG